MVQILLSLFYTKEKGTESNHIKAGRTLRNPFLKLLMQMELKDFLTVTGVIGKNTEKKLSFDFCFHTL